MKHRIAGKKLNRTGPHRLALRRNLAASLFLHGRIVTTLAKAKDCRPFAEKLITRARKGTLHDRRLVAAKLRHPKAERKLFQEIAETFRHRTGGYTAIHRLSGNRFGDQAPQALLELVSWEPGEKPKAKRRRRPAARTKAETPRPDAEETIDEEKPDEEDAGDAGNAGKSGNTDGAGEEKADKA